MILSILICTLPERKQQLDKLLDVLKPQIQNHSGDVEVVIANTDRGEMTTGTKRNWLLKLATGKYTVFIDDDDMVPDYYVSEILKAAEKDPDVITFIGFMTTNGGNRVDFELRLNEKYEARIVNGKEKYFRFPNHIVPMKRDLIKNFLFPDVTKGEDYAWALQIHKAKVLQSEVHISRDMYHYDWIAVKP